MSVITFVCAGQMNSAITFPAFENGQTTESAYLLGIRVLFINHFI